MEKKYGENIHKTEMWCFITMQNKKMEKSSIFMILLVFFITLKYYGNTEKFFVKPKYGFFLHWLQASKNEIAFSGLKTAIPG